MDSHARCWLVVAAVAPLVAALSLWCLLTFHSYRRQWRTVDLFLVAAVSQEFINALFLFGYALLNLTQPSLAPLCSLFTWAGFAVRTFQVTTLTSLVVDRAMTIKWPYRYRLSVRRNQVRYHIVVIATIAILVGVASMFASEDHAPSADSGQTDWDSTPDGRGSERATCFLLPFAIDKKFVIFVIVLHGLLTLLSFLSLTHVQIKLCTAPSTSSSSSAVNHIRIPHHLPNPFLSLDSPMSTTATPPSATMMSNGNTWSVAPHTGRSSFSLKRELTRLGRDFRWKIVVTLVVTCTLVNHIPYLVMVGLARFTNLVPPLWLEGGATYLALVEGLLLPALLWGIDPMYKTAVAQTCVRMGKTGKPKAAYLEQDMEGGSTSRRGSLSCSTLPRLEPSSTYSSVNGFVCSDTLDKKVLLTNESKWSTNESKRDPYLNASSFFVCTEKDSCEKDRLKLNRSESPEPVYCDPTEMAGGNCTLGSNATEEHIYATLSDRYACSTISECDGDMDDDRGEPLVDEYGDDTSSVTTSASDDFEFHHTRPSFCITQESPKLNRLRCSVNQGFPLIWKGNEMVSERKSGNLAKTSEGPVHNSPSGYEPFIFSQADVDRKRNFHHGTELPSTTPSRASTLSLKSVEECSNTKMPVKLAARHMRHSKCDGTMDVCCPARKTNDGVATLTRCQRNASLSMNDIDMLTRLNDEDTEEIVYVLSGKSESTLSLYKFKNGGRDDDTLDRPLIRYARCLPTQNDGAVLGTRCQSSRSLQDNQKDWNSPEIFRSESCQSPCFNDHRMDTQSPTHGKRQYHRNPLLARTRLYKSNAAIQPGGHNANNWKYRASVFPRQDFPWRKSHTRPFKIPSVAMISCHASARKNPGYHIDFNECRDYEHGDNNNTGMSYQKKFVSDFL